MNAIGFQGLKVLTNAEGQYFVAAESSIKQHGNRFPLVPLADVQKDSSVMIDLQQTVPGDKQRWGSSNAGQVSTDSGRRLDILN